jgi:hypothetical protein
VIQWKRAKVRVAGDWGDGDRVRTEDGRGVVGKKSPFDLPGSAARTEETDSPGNAFAAWGVRDGRGGVYTTTSTVPWQPISLSLSRAQARLSCCRRP